MTIWHYFYSKQVTKQLINTTEYNDMAFKKGESGNPKGKPKGAKNKTTEEMKEILIKAVFEDSHYSIKDDLDELNPKDRLTLKAAFAKFILPSMKAVDAKVTTQGDTSLGFSIDYKANTDDLKDDK